MKNKVLKENGTGKEMQLAHRIYRGISRKISPLISRAPLTPNQISVISLLFIIAGSVLVGFGEYMKVLIGAAIIQIGMLLDFVDGDVARIRGMSSLFGNWLDCVLDRAGDLAVLIGLIIGVANNPQYLSEWFEYVGIADPLPAILTAGILLIGLRFAVDSTYAYTLLYAPGSVRIYKETKKSLLMEIVFSRVTFIYFLIFIAAIFNLLPLYFIGLVIYLLLWYPTLLAALFLKVRKLQS
ncbi:hypothetical protein GF345_01450 [Candidatus Woesearchaeota archaeon]|nr:hypothetical protein [Candidatus Woesearchaeota archaeon]